MKKLSICLGLVFVFTIVSYFSRVANFSKIVKENNNLLLPDVVVGDVDGKDGVTPVDYLLVKKHMISMITLTKEQYARADLNGDNDITPIDYIEIKKIMLGMRSEQVTYQDVKVIDGDYSYIVADFNVLDYGADSTGVKDSTAAFKSALAKANTCVRTGGSCSGTVYVPKGKYLLTDKLVVESNTALIGDLKEGTADGTVLVIKHGAGSDNANNAAIEIETLGSIQNIAFWYPDQKLSGGTAVKYPPTISSNTLPTTNSQPSDYITLENLYFVNSYIAMDLHASSVQFIRRIYGTPLSIGIINDRNWDTIKMENVNFSPKYWLNSGLSNVPSSDAINKVTMNLSVMPAAIVLERVDWTLLANINIDGYFFGLKFTNGETPGYTDGPEGELYDSKITNCYYPIYIYDSRHFAITGTTLSATGGTGARGIHISERCHQNYTINNCTISSTGDYAIYHGGEAALAIGSSKITGRIGKAKSSNTARMTLVGDTLTNTGYESLNIGGSTAINKKNYTKRVVTKPKSKSLIKITAALNSDITSKIKAAIAKLKSTGGIVYIPSGVYIVSDHIDVPSGIEIHGATPWAFQDGGIGETTIQTTYKKDSLFTLQSNSGINGIAVSQTENMSNVIEYPYVIKGHGSNVYIMNVALHSVWNGIDLTGCDNHYVEHALGTFYNIGINVGGGSKNGIIRDSHFQITLNRNGTEKAIQTVFTRQTAFKIGSSSNEIILHTFVFGTGIGYHFDGASDFYAAGIGSDYSSVGIKLSGNNTGQIINSLVALKPWGAINAKTHGVVLSTIYKDASSLHYIETTSNYSGLVDIYNSMNWGSNDSIALDFSGGGDLHINSGIVDNSASPALRTSNAAQSIVGVIFSMPRNTFKYQIDSGVWGAAFVGNICLDGKSCVNGIKNNARIEYSNVDTSIK